MVADLNAASLVAPLPGFTASCRFVICIVTNNLLGGLGVGAGSVELDSLFGFMRGPQSFNELLCLFVYVSDVPATVSAEFGQQFLQRIRNWLTAFPRY